MARKYSNVSKVMSLAGAINSSVTSLTVDDASGLPVTFPYAIAVDYEGAALEIMLVTAAAGNTLTVTRGQEDTAAQAHSTGAVVVHAATAQDFQSSADHQEATQNVHGVGPGNSVVGTGTSQTLTNKTMSGANNTFSNIPGSAITGTIPTATIAVANVTGDWPIDTRSTGSIPVDTRTTGNLPGSRLASPVTANMTFSGTATFSSTATHNGAETFNGATTFNQPPVGGAITVNANSNPGAAAIQVTADEQHPGLYIKRNNSTTTGRFAAFDTEAATSIIELMRDGRIRASSTVRGSDFVIIGTPDRNVKAELDNLNGPPRFQGEGSAAVNQNTFTVVTLAVNYNIGGFTYSGGILRVPQSGFYEMLGVVDWSPPAQAANTGVSMAGFHVNGGFNVLARDVLRGTEEGGKVWSMAWSGHLVAGQDHQFLVYHNCPGGGITATVRATVKWTGNSP